LIKCGVLEHLIISKILRKKYPKIFEGALSKTHVELLGNCRYELEEFELQLGRYYEFSKDEPLGEELEDALNVFREINAVIKDLINCKSERTQVAKELSQEVEFDGKVYSLV
jgi:dsRNA-specific ribonuclease